MTINYRLAAVIPYINWDYFYFAWGIHNKSEEEKMALRHEAEQLLQKYGWHYNTHAIFELLEANSDGDDILVWTINYRELKSGRKKREVKEYRLPFLRQQQGNPCMCLADFIAPCTMNGLPAATHQIGLFATSVDEGMEHDFDNDPYEKMMMQLMADRLAEATAERLHKEVRQTYWGYAKDEHLPMEELHTEQFKGIRPAVGYPSLPDASINFLIDEILDMKQIGIELTESGAMRPHASVSGLMIAHPHAHYFDVGRSDEAQLQDYARRRGLPVEEMRKFLQRNL